MSIKPLHIAKSSKFSVSRRAPNHQTSIPENAKDGAKESDISHSEAGEWYSRQLREIFEPTSKSPLSLVMRQNSLDIPTVPGKSHRKSKPLPAIPADPWTIEDSRTTYFTPDPILPAIFTFRNSSRPPPRASIPTDIENSVCVESPLHPHDIEMHFDIESTPLLLVPLPVSDSAGSTTLNFVLSRLNEGSSPDTSETHDRVLHSHGTLRRRNGIITPSSKVFRFHVRRRKIISHSQHTSDSQSPKYRLPVDSERSEYVVEVEKV